MSKITEKEIYFYCDNGIEEDWNIDFKQAASLAKTEANRKELCKDVAAFANGGGGRIIYGMQESRPGDSKGKAKASDIEAIDPATVDTEWMYQVLGSNVSRKIEGVKVYTVPLTERGHSGKCVVVVDIPQSMRAPHQLTIDKKYPKRSGNITDWMHEYEIRDLYHRSEAPDLELTFEPKDQSFFETTSEAPGTYAKQIPLQFHLLNRSNIPVEYAVVRFWLDPRLYHNVRNVSEIQKNGRVSDDSWLRIPEEFVKVRNLRPQAGLICFQRNWHSQKGDMPILELEDPCLTSNPFLMHLPSQANRIIDHRWEFQFEISAPKMQRKLYMGQFLLGMSTLSIRITDVASGE